MSNYQVTARKWRPQDFSQLVGQEHVTTALTNAINSGKIPHAYLFSGPRGVGKTSSARILSKMLTCVESPNICGKCTACIEISTGQSLDVREIDGASNRGIEQIREIRDNVVYTPLSLKYKIFIIDEVHMLTKEASNALLKVLEEPPSHVIFMLATTEANKILPTIRSRCQHYLLKRIPLDTLVNRLSLILEQEGHTFEVAAVEEIALAGDGSMRDSQTILDQVVLYSEGNITLASTREVLGIPESSYFENILQAITQQDIVTILEQVNKYLMEMGDGTSFAEHLTKFLRKALLIKKLPASHPLLELTQEKYDLFSDLIAPLEEQDILTLLNLSLDLANTLRQETAERFWIESTMFKMLDYKNRISLSELRQEIFKAIGRQHGANVSASPTPTPRPTSAPESRTPVAAPATPSSSTPTPKGSFASRLEEHQQSLNKSVPKAAAPAPQIEPVAISTPEAVQTTDNEIEKTVDTPSTPKPEPIQAPTPVAPTKPVANAGDSLEGVISNLFETQ